MEKNAFEDFLRRRYYPTLTQYKNRAFRNQQFYKGLQWSTIILSVTTAMLLGVQQLYDWTALKILSLGTSVIVSGLAMTLKTFSYQEKWAFYNKMSIDLENEFDLYQSNGGAYTKELDKESFFVSRIISLLNQGTESLRHATLPPPSSATNEHDISDRERVKKY